MAAKTKRPPSTRKILERCIEDIKIGGWCQHHLSRETKLNGLKKPMGCALGLVGIESGSLEVRTWEVDGSVYAEADGLYPSEGGWNGPALKAVDLLSRTTKLSKRKQDQIRDINSDDPLYAIQKIVSKYNDRTNKQGAIAWFKRALALLDAPKEKK